MKNYLSIILSIAIAFSQALYVEVFAQETCDENLIPAQDSDERYQKRGMRCEGFYESPISASDVVELVSLTKGNFDYNLSKTDTIRIVPLTAGDQMVTIQAKPIPLRIYYRMDAVLNGGSLLKWPVGDVLFKSEFKSDLLGITGWINTQTGDKIYVPLNTSSIEKLNGENEDVIHLVLRSNVDIDKVHYSLFPYQDNNNTDWVAISKYSTFSPAGAPITINLRSRPPGRYRLKLAYLFPDQVEEEDPIWQTSEFLFQYEQQ